MLNENKAKRFWEAADFEVIGNLSSFEEIREIAKKEIEDAGFKEQLKKLNPFLDHKEINCIIRAFRIEVSDEYWLYGVKSYLIVQEDSCSSNDVPGEYWIRKPGQKVVYGKMCSTEGHQYESEYKMEEKNQIGGTSIVKPEFKDYYYHLD